MENLPLDIIKIIDIYARDMQLLEIMPTPGPLCGSISPLNFQTILGSSSLTDLLVANIMEAVVDSEAHTLTSLFLNSRLAEVIDFPLTVINDFENACSLWARRCKLYNIKSRTLPPMWRETLPFLLFEFISLYDVDVLVERLHAWLGSSYDIEVRTSHPYLSLHAFQFD